MKPAPTLPSLSQLPIKVLKLTPPVQQTLIKAEITTLGELFQASLEQQKFVRASLKQGGMNELVLKTTRFYRTYHRVKTLLETAAKNQPEPIQESPVLNENSVEDWDVNYNLIPLDVLGLTDQNYEQLLRIGIWQVGQLILHLENEDPQGQTIPNPQQSEIKEILKDFLLQPQTTKEQLISSPREIHNSSEFAVPINETKAKGKPSTHQNTKKQMVAPELYNIPIKKLEIPRKLIQYFNRFGIWSVGAAAALSDAELTRINGVGPTIIIQIREQIAELQASIDHQSPTIKSEIPKTNRPPSIEDLNLSTRSFRALYRGGIHSFDQLIALSYDDLLKIQNLGPMLADEIETKLEKYIGRPLSETRAQFNPIQTTTELDPESYQTHSSTPINTLNLGTRISNILRRGRVKTIGDLLALPHIELLLLPGMGPQSLKEIQEKLDAFLDSNVGLTQTLIPSSLDTNLQEVLERWFNQLLTTRQRLVIEQRFGLYTEKQTLEELGQHLDLSRQRVQQIQLEAQETLRKNSKPIDPLLDLIRAELPKIKNILQIDVWANLLKEKSYSIGSIQLEGLFRFLTEFDKSWVCYKIVGQLVLFTEVTTRKEAEEKLAEWQNEAFFLTEVENQDPTTSPDSAIDSEIRINSSIKFALDLEIVLRNCRQWNRDLKTENGRAAWGRRTVTYFVYDPTSNDFAPSKFCAYTLDENWNREKRQLTIPIYAQIDPEDPIFDGQNARQHLTSELDFEYLTPLPGTVFEQAFKTWTLTHKNHINIHPAGPRILVPHKAQIPTNSLPNATETPVIKQKQPQATKRISPKAVSPSKQKPRTIEKLSKNNLFYEIEMELREQLKKVDLIGELAVDREQFLDWCLQIQSATWKNEPIRPKRITAAFFVTMMVFAARYSEEDARNFWHPYAQSVWGLKKAGPYFQLQCRERFKNAISSLSQECELFFPQRSDGDLVRPVYHHAIIPAYLERDFVDWLKRNWREILETPEGFLIPKLRQEKSLTYLPPTLKNFITNGDTAETAAALIRNMATAASLYVEGDSLAEIHDLLAANPIEQTLWNELSQVFTEQANSGQRRHQRHRLEWLWNIEQNEMELRLRNLLLSHDTMPYQIVWVKRDTPVEEAVFADLYETLDPWQIGDEWLIDNVNFTQEGPLEGQLMVLDDNDRLLWQESIPPLPDNPAQFFRLTQQKVYAIPVSSDALKNGQYLVALKSDIQLTNANQEPITALETRTLPYILRNEFNSVALYEVTLPLTIVQNNTELETLTGSGSTATGQPPYIYGQKSINGLSPRVPPLYSNHEIWLIIPEASNRLLEQAAVEVRPQKGKLRRQLIRDLNYKVDEDNSLQVSLQSVVDINGGTYVLEVRRGLSSLLQAPLQFSIIPNIEIKAPPTQPENGRIYTPNNPPSVLLRGINPKQLGNQDRFKISEATDNWIKVTWHDLRSGCRLPYLIDDQQIPLEWPVDRFFAWVEPTQQGNILTQDKLEVAILQAVATPKSARFFSVSVGIDGQARQLPLDRHGRFRTLIRQDQLFDMLRHEKGAQVQVYANIFKEQWPLFNLQRYPEIQDISVTYDDSLKVIKFNNNLKGTWPGNFRFQLHLISNPTATPRILQNVQYLESQHLFSVDLTDGAYLFEVWDPNREQAVAKKMFGVGAVTLFGEALNLLESLSRGTIRQMPRWLANDMIHFLVAETDHNEEGVSILTPEWLWQLALLQPRAYEGIPDEELSVLWTPLLAFKKIHNLDEWENKNGLLPDWAVMPAQLELKFDRFKIPITVEPELVSRQGKRGIGHSLLKLGTENVEEYVYVSWEPAYREFVEVTLGIPDKSPGDTDYTKIDVLDIGSVYQCQQCGRFVKSIILEEVREQHKHRLKQPRFKDVLNHPDNYQLLAEVMPKRVDLVRDYRLGPEFFVNREEIKTWLRNTDELPSDYPSIEFSLARYAYLSASQKWVKRYHHNSKTTLELDRLIGNTKWRNGFDRLAYFIIESKRLSVPAWGALGRFLAAFERRRDKTVLDLDWFALLLALMVRTITYNRSQISTLYQQTNFNETDLAEMLATMNTHCPELLSWAFTWTEVFFIHSTQ